MGGVPAVVAPDVEQSASRDVLNLIAGGSGGIEVDGDVEPGPSSVSDHHFEGRRSTRLSQLPSTSGLSVESLSKSKAKGEETLENPLKCSRYQNYYKY